MNKTQNNMSFHKLERRLREHIITKDEQNILNELKHIEIKKRKEIEVLRQERMATTDYEKELKRNDLTQKQRIFYRKMAEWQKNE